MVKFLADDEKQQCKDLYQQAFPEDSDAFLKYYFTVKTARNRIMVDEEDGKILSMANLNPHSIVFYTRKQELDYIVAVATDKMHRRQGRMREILKAVFETMYQERKPFTYLKPAKKEYYLPFGFNFISEKWETEQKEGIKLKEVILTSDMVSDEQIQGYKAVLGEEYFTERQINPIMISDSRQKLGFGGGLFDIQIRNFQSDWLHSNVDVYRYRTQEYLEELFFMLKSDDGQIALYFNDANQVVGVYIYGASKKKESLEFLGDLDYFNLIATKKPDKMARIIHLEEFVQVFHLKKDSLKQIETIKLRIKDDMILENNGTYLWHLNREFSYIEKLENEDSLEVLEVDIGDFVAWAFGQKELDGGYVLEEIQRLHTTMINEEV